jgi:hypothetical protein
VGVLNLFQDITVDYVELAARSKDIDEIKYSIVINKKKYLNTTWNLFIRLKNNDIIFYC